LYFIKHSYNGKSVEGACDLVGIKNPIEFIWKSIKQVISHSFIKDIEHLREIIECSFLKYAVKLSFARG
jgi:hypothetical protein